MRRSVSEALKKDYEKHKKRQKEVQRQSDETEDEGAQS
jgi:hypothetical protein